MKQILTDEEIAELKRDFGFGINDLNWWEAVRAIETAVLEKLGEPVLYGEFAEDGGWLGSASEYQDHLEEPIPLYAIDLKANDCCNGDCNQGRTCPKGNQNA